MTTAIARISRTLVTLLVIAVLFIPVIRDRDSFPLSTQPMYATARDGIEWLPSARAVDGGGGDQVRLSMALVADTDDPLIAKSRLEQAIRRDSARELCEQVAGRVALDEDLTRFDLVEVLSERFDLVSFVADGAEPLEAQVHARCLVTP